MSEKRFPSAPADPSSVRLDGRSRPEENPWKTLSTAEIYETPWFRVREDQVIRPDGRLGTYSVVSAARMAAGILPLWPDGSVTLVGQYRYAVSEYSWEIPEGGGTLDADPEQIARTELLEETGIRAATWEYLGPVHTSNCFVDEVCHLFLARDLTQGEPRPEPVEVLRLRREPLATVAEMALDGRITDGISIAGIFRVLARLGFDVGPAR